MKFKKRKCKIWDGHIYFCNNCQHRTDIQHRFCPYCGIKFEPNYPISIKEYLEIVCRR